MKFSEVFAITQNSEDDWFDPILSIDTQLFIDPFLLYNSEKGFFKGSHDQVVQFFNDAYMLIARAGGNKQYISYRKALNMLIFPEAQELCLGYTSSGTRGFGSGEGFAKIIAEAIWEAIQAGVDEITHFEEIGIFRERIGADRISDITACLLRRRLADYTIDICQRHNIETTIVNYRRGEFNAEKERWMPLSVSLPMNPSTKKPILLVPRQFIRELPTISADDFWEYCYDNENEVLRNDFNDDIARKVCKEDIVNLARNHPELRQKYLAQVEERDAQPYDFNTDKKGYVVWYEASKHYCVSKPRDLSFGTEEEFLDVIASLAIDFKHYIEQNNGWRLLWNDNGTPKGEKAAQFLFLGIVAHYCRANNIDVSPEVNIGRGPVDFKVSQGYDYRSLFEVKLAKNTKFWNGLNIQFPTYLKAEKIKDGCFLVVLFSKKDEERLKDIQSITDTLSKKTGLSINTVVVDAQPKPSASTL